MNNSIQPLENEPFFDLRFITLVAALLLSFVSIVLSAVFGWQLGHGSVLLSITFVIMQVGLAIAEFLAASHLSIMRRNKDISGIIVSFLILISGLVVNVWAAQSLIALKMNEIENHRRFESDEYKRWLASREDAQQRLDSFNVSESNYKNAQDSIKAYQQELYTYFAQPAINSNGQRSGQSVGQITSNCADQGGWYVDKYCSKVAIITRQIEQQKALIAKYEEFLMAKDKLVTIEKQVPPQGATDETLPGITNIAVLSGTTPEMVKARILIFLSLCVELFAIGLWFLLQRLSFYQWVPSEPPQRRMYAYSQEPDLVEPPQRKLYAKNSPQVPYQPPPSTQAIPAKSDNIDNFYQQLKELIYNGSLDNLSYNNIKKHVGANNTQTKILRERLVQEGIAHFVGQTKTCVPIKRE